MTKLLSMTYNEYYGDLPTALLRLYRANNAAPVDHDLVLMKFNCQAGDDDIPWPKVVDFVKGHCKYGQLRLPLYL